jgi:hypothetical protein
MRSFRTFDAGIDELGLEARQERLRLAAAFDELAKAI